MNVVIIIPAYNEASVIATVVKQIRDEGYSQVIVIDDNSCDKTGIVARKAGAKVIRHKRNLGAGGATRTGLEYAKTQNVDFAVTLDADGQHDPKEISKLLRFARAYDVIIGSRMIRPKGMPLTRKVLNFGGSIVTWMLYGIHVRDSQSGFKVFNKNAIHKIKIHMTRFEFCSEILYRIRKNKLTYKEVPIRTIYTAYSLSKGQHAFNGVKMLWRMILNRIKLKQIDAQK